MAEQYAISGPHYENLPLRDPHPPTTCSENHLEIGSNSATIHPQAGAILHTTGKCTFMIA